MLQLPRSNPPTSISWDASVTPSESFYTTPSSLFTLDDELPSFLSSATSPPFLALFKNLTFETNSLGLSIVPNLSDEPDLGLDVDIEIDIRTDVNANDELSE